MFWSFFTVTDRLVDRDPKTSDYCCILAILPIGDLFTMGPADALKADQLIRPQRVAPAHYNTWPPIEQDAEQWAEEVRQQTEAEPQVLAPGETLEV